MDSSMLRVICVVLAVAFGWMLFARRKRKIEKLRRTTFQCNVRAWEGSGFDGGSAQSIAMRRTRQ